MTFSVLLIIVGIELTANYFGLMEQSRKERLKQLIETGNATHGLLSSNYTVKVTKIKGLELKDYVFPYTFNVNGKTYYGKAAFDSIPTDLIVSIKYFAKNPSDHEVNPKEKLKSLTDTENSSFLLILGLGLFIFGSLRFYYHYKTFNLS